MHSQNWDDLRYVLAVAETGSLSGAARQMRVNHATVLRHISAFEAAHGGAVFERSPHGYRLLPDRVRVIDAAREAANAMHSVARLMRGAKAPLRGSVRVSSVDSFCVTVLPDLVTELHAEFSDLRIELLSSNTHLDFARMQADVSVRPAPQLSDDMSGEIAAELRFAVYGASKKIDNWLGFSGPLARSAPSEWLAAQVAPEQFAAGSDSFLVLRELAARGVGACFLPCFLGDEDARLCRLRDVAPDLSVPIWVASQSDLADVARLRTVRRRIVSHLQAMAPRLAGLS